MLKHSLEQAAKDAAGRRAATGITVHGASPGIYVEFEAVPGWELAIPSLEHTAPDPFKRIEVVAVTEHRAPADERAPTAKPVQRATVFVPDGQVSYFLKQFERYALTTPKKERERRHENSLDRVAALRLATLRALWTDDAAAYPDDGQPIWWEVWLRVTDGQELARLHEYAAHAKLKIGERRLELDDRIIVLVWAAPNQLSAALDVLNDIGELRRAKELATFFLDQGAEDQARWAQDLAGRLVPPPDDAPAVTVLDTGVSRAHPLLVHALAPQDVHAVDSAWGGSDDGGGRGLMGHGTEMAGLALHGDLAQVLPGQGPVHLHHRLESVKLLPPEGFAVNAPDLYGALTAAAVSRPEIQAPSRARVFSMAVTADDARDLGRPSSWSAAIDALSAGRSFDATKQGLIYLDDGASPVRRLFVISAGNASASEKDHLAQSDRDSVEDPAQAWNALTVGAHTERALIQDGRWQSWRPLARPGDLSPFSRTSVGFDPAWPSKPDVVAEGGNAGVNEKGDVHPIDDLLLLTTYYRPAEKQFVWANGTSAACAQVARLCARIAADYPEYWPETIRALVVHSARWTQAMDAHLKAAGDSKRARSQLVRRYGYGVPTSERALRSASDALTLVAQDVIRPFKASKLRELRIHELPWPKAELELLGDTQVQLRVTLSYFVEPNPARRGWQKRHRYQSHGLRFEVKRPFETLGAFRKRLNQQEDRPGAAADEGWYLGVQARNRGSVHCDIWTGTAQDLAERGAIAVFPVTGWWKEQPKRDRSEQGARYALIVSIETPTVATDIWTPVAQEVGIPAEVVAIEG